MNDFLIILGATTLSGSFIFGVIKLFDRKFYNQIFLGHIYLFMKIALLYFLLPGIFIIITLLKIRSYNNILLIGAPDIIGMSNVGNLKNIALEEFFLLKLLAIKFILIIWLVGVVITIFVINLRKGINLRRLYKMCIPVENIASLKTIREMTLEYKIKRKITLYDCPYVSSPFLFGVINLKMIIPNIELSREELEIICRHEFTHYKHHDGFFRILVGLVQAINWFNPMIMAFSHMFYDYGELTCDEQTSNQLTILQKSTYSHLLIRLHEEPYHVSHTVAFSNDGESFLRRRVSIIMKKTNVKKTAAAFILAFSIAILTCPLIAFASSWSALQVHNEILGAVIVNNSKEELNPAHEYTEYTETTNVLQGKTLLINSVTRGANSVDFTIAAGDSVVTSKFAATAGKGIRIFVSGDSSSDSFRAGIVNTSGQERYVNSQKGAINHTFNITEAGTYAVYFENTGDSDVHILGTIYVNY